MNEHTNQPQAHGPKRLYRIKDGAMIWGVCRGLAHYLNIDVTIVRILFIIATVFGHGLGILVYGVIRFLAPEVHSLGSTEPKTEPFPGNTNPKEHIQAFGKTLAWVGTIVGSIFLVALGIAWIFALIIVTTTSSLLFFPFFLGLSPVVFGIIITLIFCIISWPIKHLTEKSYELAQGVRLEHTNGFQRLLAIMGWVIAIVLFIWFILTMFPVLPTNQPYGNVIQVNGRHICVGGNGFCG